MQYLSSLIHPDEVIALFKLGYARSAAGATPLHEDPKLSASLRWCYLMLEKTSRSFAFVIRELDAELRDVICIFYLVLRGLDTVEDDTAVPLDQKLPILIEFHEKLLQPGWNLTGCGEKKDEITLVENFDKVIDVFQSFQQKYQVIIKDVTRRMGAGFADFCQRPVVTVEDYNLYCHYAAGLVGLGLSNIFAASGLEDSWFATAENYSNKMGLFLQKTNIIRDYLEDINQVPKSRMFWPKDIWGKYAKRLEDFREPQHLKEAVHCLNDLITDALDLLEDCLVYMSKLKNPKVFTFCAIPQVMAIATLATCYNNPNVFRGVVKIRRGQNAKIILDLYSGGMQAVYQHALDFTNQLAAKISSDDPNAALTRQRVEKIRELTTRHLTNQEPKFGMGDLVAIAAFATSSVYLVTKYNPRRFFAKL